MPNTGGSRPDASRDAREREEVSNRILGIGVDLVPVDRIARGEARQGPDFLAAILTPAELERCRAHGVNGARREVRAASYFAAKEAFLKALGTGLVGRLSWHDIEVVPEGRSGRAALALRGEAARLAAEAGIGNVETTLAVTARHAAAMVVVSS